MAVLGRVATDQAWQGRGFGHLLVRDARTRQAAEASGILGPLVHALSPAAKRFHEGRGFRESPANPMTLMVILSDAIAAIGDWRRLAEIRHGLRWSRRGAHQGNLMVRRVAPTSAFCSSMILPAISLLASPPPSFSRVTRRSET